MLDEARKKLFSSLTIKNKKEKEKKEEGREIGIKREREREVLRPSIQQANSLEKCLKPGGICGMGGRISRIEIAIDGFEILLPPSC